MVQTEFQAIVFGAGKGSRMPEIVGNTPKCLLPVGNKPMVWYSLRMLEYYGFQETILIVNETQKSEIQISLEKTDLTIKIDYFSISISDELGTADSLKMLGEKITKDFICVSCDFVTDFDLHEALNVFRKHNASLVSVFFKPEVNNNVVPGPKPKHKPERDLIGIDSNTNRLVFLASASDFEENLTISKNLLKKFTNVKMYSNLIDAHLYVMKHWIFEYIQQEDTFSTIKGELLPHIIKKQLSKIPKSVDEKTTSVVNNDSRHDIFAYVKEEKLDLTIRELSTFNDHTGDMKDCYHGDAVRCYAYIAPGNKIGCRLNTIPSYWHLNSKIIDVFNQVTFGKGLTLLDPKAEIKSNQIDSKCFILEGAKLQEKTSFKSCIIGASSEVQSKSRVFNSILMNQVTVKERCAIENCIICEGAVIESGTTLKYCIVGSQHKIPENSSYSKELLTDSDKFIEY